MPHSNTQRCYLARVSIVLLTAIMVFGTSDTAYARGLPTGKPNSATPPEHRPKIGLALSGGGARGYAHIGILTYLEQHRIPIDYIAATSVGALVGGLYASGMSATELERRLATINLADIAFDHKERGELRQSLREDDFKYPIGLSLGYGNGQVKVPSAIIEGTDLLMLIQNWTAQFPSKMAFDTLPTPFMAITTDLSNGQEVALKTGSLSHAMRASMAVPGLFSAFQIGEKTLVDGAMSSNLPIAHVRSMGADIIIAVNIGAPLRPPEALQSPTAMAQQMLGIFIQKNVQAHKALLTQHDILIEPELERYGFTDFAQAAGGIHAGHLAAQKHQLRLDSLALSPEQWAHYLQQRNAKIPAQGLVTIDAIRIDMHGSRIPPWVIERELTIRVGDIYDVDVINANLTQLSNSDFNNVTQELVEENGQHILLIHAREKNWGPQFFLLGFGMSNNFNGRGNFNLQLGHRYPWMTRSGLAWRNDIIIGTNQVGIRSELRQSLLNTLNTLDVYVAPYMDYRGRYADYYQTPTDDKGNILNTQYRSEKATVGIDVGLPLALFGELRTGFNYQYAKRPAASHHVEADRPDTTAKLFRQSTWQTQMTIDQLDDALFPRRGYFLYTEANYGLGAPAERYNTVQIRALQAASYQRHTLNVNVEAARALDSEVRSLNPGFSLGGFQRLSVYSDDRFTGNYLLYARVTYLNTLSTFRLPGLSSTVIGTSIEAGNVWQTRQDFGVTPLKKNIALFVGGNSPVGPLYLGGAFAPQGLWNIYLQIGRVF